jgi:hypothetical protein
LWLRPSEGFRQAIVLGANDWSWGLYLWVKPTPSK